MLQTSGTCYNGVILCETVTESGKNNLNELKLVTMLENKRRRKARSE